MKNRIVNIIGGGYAGTEAALTLANFGVEVHLFNLPQPLPAPIENNAVNRTLKQELLALGVNSLDGNNLDGICLKNEKKLNENAKIMIFDKKVTEISLQEPTIIATGSNTDEQFLSQIESMVGKNHVHRFCSLFPEFKGRINGIKEEGEMFIPLSKEQLNLVRQFLCQFDSQRQTIEKFAQSGEQVFKAKVARPVLVNGKVYESAIKFKNINGAWRLINFQTELNEENQDKLFSLIPQLKNCKVVRYGSVNKFTHINAGACLNNSLQLINNPNIFFAGAILGIDGELEAIGTGHLAALNMLSFIDGLSMPKIPHQSALAQILNKIFSLQGVKNEQILKSCDIIKKNPEAITLLKNFKEDYNARISRHDDLCSKKRW